jgi:dUTP pyrophosphatase
VAAVLTSRVTHLNTIDSTLEIKPGTLLGVKLLSPRATLPTYQTAGAAGMDLHACLAEGVTLVMKPGDILKVPTGIAIAVPGGLEAQVRARSGLASKHGITPVNGIGTIDSDYRGEVIVPLINLGREPFEITHGLRIVQLVIAPVVRVLIEERLELCETTRGSGGFGSTGI